MNKLNLFRKKYPRFVYESYSYQLVGKKLEVFFNFRVDPDINFKPKITIEGVTPKAIKRLEKGVLKNLIFHLGLMEMPSYWKAACSPEILVEAGYLNSSQVKWWEDLILNGMGQFFYENRINWKVPGFLKISSIGKKEKGTYLGKLKNRYLVPIGGGKDSIVTLELLKKQKKEINMFSVNPIGAVRDVLKIAKIKKPIIVRRTIDPQLLRLNKLGYLNGHTPFTGVLSFLSVFCAVLFDYGVVAFSNEKSANEGNVIYLGKVINHQYAKSSAFENKFRSYTKKYLAKNLNYFSFLRKYTELEISEMFSKYPKYFSGFSSCNVGIKIGKKWCGKCPKCLFVYMILYPFLDKKELIKIFGRDLYMKKELLSLFKVLVDKNKIKPFECVGTKQESRLALRLGLKKAKKEGNVPYLLKKI